MTWASPVSRSTSTSTTWVPKVGPAPCALSEAEALIGPPVLPADPARAARSRGSKSPALLLVGRAAPFSHTTASTGMSQIFAARSRRSWMRDRAASMTAIPLANVTRLPPVRKV